jgi:hypothetical protein
MDCSFRFFVFFISYVFFRLLYFVASYPVHSIEVRSITAKEFQPIPPDRLRTQASPFFVETLLNIDSLQSSKDSHKCRRKCQIDAYRVYAFGSIQLISGCIPSAVINLSRTSQRASDPRAHFTKSRKGIRNTARQTTVWSSPAISEAVPENGDRVFHRANCY